MSLQQKASCRGMIMIERKMGMKGIKKDVDV